MGRTDAFKVTVHTHETRAGVLADTLTHLETHNVTPHVAVHTGVPSPWGNRLTARDALGMARPWPKAGVLMLEDDVRLHDDWRDWVGLSIIEQRPVFGYMSYSKCYPGHIRESIEKGECVKAGLYPMEHVNGMWGTQCVYLPHWFLEQIWNDERLHAGPDVPGIDGWPIDNYFAVVMGNLPKSRTPLIAVPNFCAHVNPPAVLKPHRRGHHSFTQNATICN